MIVEPRQASPGALLRWSRQALGLLVRGFGSWLGLLLLMCLGMFASHRLPLVAGALALAAFFSSIIVAACVDQPRRVSLGEVLGSLRAHAVDILLFAGVICAAGALIWVLLLAKPGVPWWQVLYTERNSVGTLSQDWFIAARQVFVYSAYALGLAYFGLNIPALTSFFQFPCVTLLGMPFRAAYRLSAAGQIRNLPVILGIGLLFITLPVLFALLLPPVVPLLYGFLGSVTYVAFREIFLGITANRVREAAAGRAPAAGAATA